ncbi:hypothetical protein EUTSA_v10025261mg [Eutrema salsugineum]|uniref:mannan endo-1,4-beta-mannosidase n=1 Tax=Eutrema salsugineum TaxID=72664 RepID=V4LUV5_EUTSA|nr:mannan endo-1,4-beta-mannosidase 5 isoform X2 [Eutrema salsugineum]ESQ54425.1 hypothetical protein EUTSA_v10025261mg [Eutrema salsugineum]
MAPARNGAVLPILGFLICAAFIYFSFRDLWLYHKAKTELGFVKRNGTQFVVDGKALYVNGWNSYWFMDHAVNEHSRYRVSEMLEAGAKMGLTVCRTWAFNDGGYNALQISPGHFDERVFQALDHVIAEARKHDVRLLLSLVNNLQAYGGKSQYVKWAWQEGVGLSSSNDSFFFDPSIRKYFKNYLTALLTRKNSVTGIEYRNDPTIFAWELINEPRCSSDVSGDTLQEWIDEMTGFIKSIDDKHLLTVGLEGFYGPKSPKRLTVNPEQWPSELGTDFVRNSNSSNIDFASVHIYPDHWFHDQSFEDKLKFVVKWMQSHVEDGMKELKKPVLFTEFGLSNLNKDYEPSQRERFYRIIFDVVYKSAKRRKSGAGTLVWQLFMEGMEGFNDEFGIVPHEQDSMYRLMIEQSCRLGRVTGRLKEHKLKKLCSHRH